MSRMNAARRTKKHLIQLMTSPKPVLHGLGLMLSFAFLKERRNLSAVLRKCADSAHAGPNGDLKIANPQNGRLRQPLQ